MSETKTPIRSLEGHALVDTGARERIEELSEEMAALKGGGAPGEDGFSPIASVQETPEGAVITITDKAGTTSAEIHHGQDGKTPVKGVDYFDGAKGDPGEDGKTPVKGVDYFDGQDGASVMVTNISTSSADGGSNVVTFSDGKTLTVKNGSKGSPGTNGTTPVKGVDYFDGTNGVGVKSVTQTTTSSADGGSNVITVTLTDNTASTFTVKNGSKGSPGTNGTTPVKGTDYFTAADKADMVSQVKAALPKLTLSGVDADGVTHTYTLYGE